MMKKTQKKLTYITRTLMMVLTSILIILFFVIMSLVGQIQGTARVVNYAGLVRGETQRMIKLEDAEEPQDKMMNTISSYIQGLREGSNDLNLVCLEDKDFQNKMEELDSYFEELKKEILSVRENGYENTDIIEKSETFFGICDEAVGYAEAYSQRKASALNVLEQIVFADIAGLIILIAFELIKALRFAAQNRMLQKKVYLDEATGLPNKNKCEEILGNPEPVPLDGLTAVCVFDLNNLRTINNNLGHEKGDEYIRSFAVELRKVVPAEYFTGRDGGDEFITVFHRLDHSAMREMLQMIREHMAAYSAEHPEMPLSYAVGYALSCDFDQCTMRELFRLADKNMYVDKNHAKMEEAAERQRKNRSLLAWVREQEYYFTDCIYCDAMLDQYRILRAGSEFFLAEEGSYSGAVEQIVQILATDDTRRDMWRKLQIDYIQIHLGKENEIIQPYLSGNEPPVKRGRMTILDVDHAPDGRLHHFILGFEPFRDRKEVAQNEKLQLTRYYDQVKHSLMENGDYVDALMETAQAIYSVELTHDCLEKVYYPDGGSDSDSHIEPPYSYNAYCAERRKYVTEDTLENYRIMDSSEKLLERFENGEKQITVEYCERGVERRLYWLQKTVLMSRDMVYDSRTQQESRVVHGIILFKDTSEFHEKEHQEKERLESAFHKADLASKAKTEFLNRMSHDIRTPINGIMGMLEIMRRAEEDPEKSRECMEKIQISAGHLLELVNDVLDMSKIEADQIELPREPFNLVELMREVRVLVDAQLTETGIEHRISRGHMVHTSLIGSPLQLRQIMLNLFSNAIKYNKEGGSIETYAGELSCDGKIVYYEFIITDTGVGMSREFVDEHLFKPFTQEQSDARTQYKGTGLGMSIVQGLIQKMHGSVQVESELGKGTKITCQIPFELDTESEMIKETGEISDVTAIENLHILLAEDNEINMEIAEFYLEDMKIKVDKAWNGKDAVEMFAASEPGTYDMILRDVMMPVMDGLEAARYIRQMERSDAKKIPILALTAQVTSESIVECGKAGMDGHLTKPIEAQKLKEKIFTYFT